MKAGGIIPPLSNSAGLAGRRAVIPPLLQARLSDTLDLHAPVKQAHSGVMGANLRDTPGLRILEEREANGCVVLGDPAYYARFGFRPDPLLTLPAAPDAAFQALRFTDAGSAGEVVLHAAFGHHEYD